MLTISQRLCACIYATLTSLAVCGLSAGSAIDDDKPPIVWWKMLDTEAKHQVELGQYKLALRLYRYAYFSAQSMHDVNAQCQLLLDAAVCSVKNGDISCASLYCSKADDLSSQLTAGDLSKRIGVLSAVGRIELSLNRTDQAKYSMAQALKLYKNSILYRTLEIGQEQSVNAGSAIVTAVSELLAKEGKSAESTELRSIASTRLKAALSLAEKALPPLNGISGGKKIDNVSACPQSVLYSPKLERRAPSQSAGRPWQFEFLPNDDRTYFKDLQSRIKDKWRPPIGHEADRVEVVFSVLPNGDVFGLAIIRSSGMVLADAAALQAVEDSAPFRALPRRNHDPVAIEYVFGSDAQK